MVAVAEQKEGFEVLAELTKRHWRTLEIHADTAAAVGTGALLPAVTLPQAQLDIQHAIAEAFYAGAAFQAAMQPIVMSVAESTVFGQPGDGERKVIIERIPRLAATLSLGPQAPPRPPASGHAHMLAESCTDDCYGGPTVATS